MRGRQRENIEKIKIRTRLNLLHQLLSGGVVSSCPGLSIGTRFPFMKWYKIHSFTYLLPVKRPRYLLNILIKWSWFGFSKKLLFSIFFLPPKNAPIGLSVGHRKSMLLEIGTKKGCAFVCLCAQKVECNQSVEYQLEAGDEMKCRNRGADTNSITILSIAFFGSVLVEAFCWNCDMICVCVCAHVNPIAANAADAAMATAHKAVATKTEKPFKIQCETMKRPGKKHSTRTRVYLYNIFTNQRVMIHCYHFNDQNATEYLCVAAAVAVVVAVVIIIIRYDRRVNMSHRHHIVCLFAFRYGLLRVYTHTIRDAFQPSLHLVHSALRVFFLLIFVFHWVYFVRRQRNAAAR